MSAPSLQDLIAKLESAESGSRELDFYIARVMGWHGSDDYQKCSWLAHPDDKDESDTFYGYPDYTTSLDDALTLVPEKHFWSLDYDNTDIFDALVTTKHHASAGWVHAKTAALALCIAALKARLA